MLNFKHLHYFWVVAREGSIARASERVHITPQTISAQISLLESHLGKALFEKSGRNLVLTPTGRQVLRYADDIFALGNEIEQSVLSKHAEREQTFSVGIADVVPKTIAYRLIAPAMAQQGAYRVICRESSLNELLAELALHRLDLVIADGPIPADVSIKGFNHHLGDCGVSFMATSALAQQYRDDFPQSLHGAPMLLPNQQNLVRTHILDWLDGLRVYPRLVGEFDDSALMKVFGQAGVGVFPVPTAIANEVAEQFDVQCVGETDAVRENFYAISVARKLKHPAVLAVTEGARGWLTR